MDVHDESIVRILFRLRYLSLEIAELIIQPALAQITFLWQLQSNSNTQDIQ